MFYVSYMVSELRRRFGRSLLTALGLAVGVGLVIVVNALSTGLDDAQDEVLRPLTGVGTDMTVTRPIEITASPANGGPQLSDEERKQLEEENGPGRLGLRDLGEPGEKFSRDEFVSGPQLSFPDDEVATIRELSGVASVAGGLTLNSIHVEGIVPEEPAGGGFRAPGAGATVGPPENIDFTSLSVSGVDATNRALGAITPARITAGRYFEVGSAREAILNVSYARANEIAVGDAITLGGKKFTVVGLAQTPLGGQASDVYLKLGQLQALADRKGRVNTIYVRANRAEQVGALARHIRTAVDGASVTTAKDVADRVSGSLVDTKNLTEKLGLGLAVVALASAFLIASLLTLASVTKRIRELGTLKALGWSQRLVVRQVTGEALLQGLLGAVLGIGLGALGALAIGRFGPSLQATVEAAAGPTLRFGPGGGGPGGLGASSTDTGSTSVDLTAPVSLGLMLLAAGLALGGGLLSGAVGGLRAARLRPADALRHID